MNKLNTTSEVKLIQACKDKIEEIETNVTQVLQPNPLLEPQNLHFPELFSLNGNSRCWQPVHFEVLIKDIVSEDKEGKCRRIFILGPMGAGKTMLMTRLANTLMSERIVVFIQLQDSQMSEKILPSHALLSGHFPNNEEIKLAYDWIRKNPKKVVFFIDSLQKMSFDVNQKPPSICHDEESSQSDILHSLVCGQLVPEATIVSSSRDLKVSKVDLESDASTKATTNPSPEDHKVRKADLEIDTSKAQGGTCYILLGGLLESSIEILMNEFLGEEKGKEMKEKVEEEFPGIRAALRRPLFLVLIAAGFQADGDSFSCTASVMTTFLSNCMRSKHWDVKDASLCELMQKCLKEIMSGGKFSSSDDLQSFSERISCGSLILDGYFAHFLAALHVLKMPLLEYEDLVTEHLLKVDLEDVLVLLCGMLFNKEVLNGIRKLIPNEIHDVEDKRDSLKDHLRESVREAVDGKKRSRVLSFFKVLKELGDGMVDLIREILEDKQICFGGINISLSDACCIGSVICFLESLQRIDLRSSGLNKDKVRKLCERINTGGLKIERVGINCNQGIGSEGMKYFGMFVKNCSVLHVDLGSCNLSKEDLKQFRTGCEGKQFQKIVASNNCDMRYGWHVLGELMEDGGFLDVHYCNPTQDNLKDLIRGLGDKKVGELILTDRSENPSYNQSLIRLVPKVERLLDLSGWKFQEENYQQIKNEWQKGGEVSSLTVKIDNHPDLKPDEFNGGAARMAARQPAESNFNKGDSTEAEQQPGCVVNNYNQCNIQHGDVTAGIAVPGKMESTSHGERIEVHVHKSKTN